MNPAMPSSSQPLVASAKRSARLSAILSALAESSTVTLAELTDMLKASPATIRRDLALLEAQGFLTRTHGGAQATEMKAELPVRYRDSTERDAKVAIARKAAELIPGGRQAIAIGGGSTAAEVARNLTARTDLTIVTNSLTTAYELASRSKVKVVMTGGVIRPTSFELVGSLAEGALNAINVAMTVIGADGITAANGLTTFDDIEARTNRSMVTHAGRVVVVADSTKLGEVRLARVADLSEVTDLVIDDAADADELAKIEKLGVRVHRVRA
ncbi:DeoR/GlpR family DNA-binding transcription regulator [Paramicrobacterium agarici]|uniref:DeoR/GlpR family DNA-binding transcription regulator n=1 Tax=Paramicrobacterium agarici TaxID=630514 RepID=UPI001172BFCE|nr:DeoR/GlpR family DNA-binding transcription regulator [Microbacterium agarici]TQO22842.1 DeoR family transcriptional regulator [Microbacterium agarici]